MMMGTNNQDLEHASSYFVKDILHLKAGEKMLLYTDEGSFEDATTAIEDGARRLGVQTDLLQLHALRQLSERVAAICERIDKGNYDVVCELSEDYFYTTPVWSKGLEKGCRVYSLGDLDADSFVRCVGRVDHDKMYEFGLLLRTVLERATGVKIQTALGTNITCRMESAGVVRSTLAKYHLRRTSKVWRPSGRLRPKSSTTFLGGQIAFLGVPSTIEGTAVVDGYQWPPREAGQLDDPILLNISKGRVVEIEGSSSKAASLRSWMEGKEKDLKHFCIGFNPRANLNGRLGEAERAFGHFVIGFGAYPFHTDSIIKNPTLVLDGSVVLENHDFVHGDLKDAAQALFREA